LFHVEQNELITTEPSEIDRRRRPFRVSEANQRTQSAQSRIKQADSLVVLARGRSLELG
jgi:hypothetical protein